MIQHVLIVEDEASIAQRISRLARQAGLDDATHIEVQTSFAGGLAYLRTHPIDLLFLDLNLHGQNGFELLSELTSYAFHTIIISANTDQALQAFEYGVLDFIAKPFTLERLRKALGRLSERSAEAAPFAERLQVRKRGQLLMIPITEIGYLKAAGNYSEIHVQSGRPQLHDKSLTGLLAILPPHFLRIHRSYVCDRHQIERILKHGAGKYEAVLKNGKILPIGRQYYPEILEQLGAV